MVEIPLGIVVERRDVDHPWQDHEFVPVGIIPGAADTDSWRELARGDGWVRYHVGTLPLELHRKETESYKVNLSNDPPMIYVMLSTNDDPDSDEEVALSMVTASPYDAQDYLDSGEDILEGIPMPEDLVAWIQSFIDRHHVDEPFYKRKRKRYDPDSADRRPRVGGQRPAQNSDKQQ
jgi:hypothetical protein